MTSPHSCSWSGWVCLTTTQCRPEDRGSVEPIPQTREVLEQLLRSGEEDVATELLRMSRRAVEIVPECVGMSLALLQHGLTFTLASSSETIAGLDAVQYLDGGPCIDGAADGGGIEVDALLGEEAWERFAAAGGEVRADVRRGQCRGRHTQQPPPAHPGQRRGGARHREPVRLHPRGFRG